MPKETFYHLPEEKRKRILDAAAEEIVRVPASEISINKIIQRADISRGSFYQYFDDKHDLIQYLLSDYINILKDGIRDSLRVCRGDIFAAVCRVLSGVIALGRDERNQQGMRNIIGEADKNQCTLDFMLELQSEIVDILAEGADKTLLKNEDELILLSRLLFLLLKNAAAECLHDISQADIVKAEFLGQLEIIKRGTEKGEIDV